MRKTILAILSVLICLTSCVDKQKNFDKITSEMYVNSTATFGLTLILCKDYVTSSDYELQQVYNTFIDEGITKDIFKNYKIKTVEEIRGKN